MRQSSKPVAFDQTTRQDSSNNMTSFKAGVVAPLGVIPVHRRDSGAGRIAVQLELAEMPKPIENAVLARVQAWFVPRPALPYFAGLDEYLHSYHGKDQTALNSADRVPVPLFVTETSGAALTAIGNSEMFTTLGIHLASGAPINLDYVDAYNLIYNFRLASYSSKLTRRPYYSEDATNSLTLAPAFWPRNRMSQVVPDYERALVVGDLDLDVAAGSIPVNGLGFKTSDNLSNTESTTISETSGTRTGVTVASLSTTTTQRMLRAEIDPVTELPLIFADMTGQSIGVTLADIDKARTTQAFAKLRSAYAGNDHSGFNNDDVIISELMQGFDVPDDLFNRPWLLDSKTVTFGMVERHATDAANLDDSVSTGVAQAMLSVNLPKAHHGGVIIYTCEVMPELLTERASDEYLHVTDVNDLPNALRDVQRPEPVDQVLSRRIDVAHTTPDALYGYEPMNAKWQREFTRLGGEFLSATPGSTVTSARTAIWQAEVVDPVFADDHYLCPSPFPQDVFSLPSNDVVNAVSRHDIMFTGITQFGDMLVEDEGEFGQVLAERDET